MIRGFVTLLGCQLAGEALTRWLALPVPGPVIGLVLLFLGLQASAALGRTHRDRVEQTSVGVVAAGLLGNLALLFVPAGAGVVQNLDLLAEHGVALATVLVGSTVLTMIATVYAFRGVSRLMTSGRGFDET